MILTLTFRRSWYADLDFRYYPIQLCLAVQELDAKHLAQFSFQNANEFVRVRTGNVVLFEIVLLEFYLIRHFLSGHASFLSDEL